jgi:hypothetical protein
MNLPAEMGPAMKTLPKRYAQGNRTWTPCWAGRPQPRRSKGKVRLAPVVGWLDPVMGLLCIRQTLGRAYVIDRKSGSWRRADRTLAKVQAASRAA